VFWLKDPANIMPYVLSYGFHALCTFLRISCLTTGFFVDWNVLWNRLSTLLSPQIGFCAMLQQEETTSRNKSIYKTQSHEMQAMVYSHSTYNQRDHAGINLAICGKMSLTLFNLISINTFCQIFNNRKILTFIASIYLVGLSIGWFLEQFGHMSEPSS
jgi:hypothetical protein